MSEMTVTGAEAWKMIAAAPHRLLFFIGASNVLLAMAWWALWLSNAQWRWFDMPQPVVPAGWMHAMIMQYQVLPPFMFGFLLTVFPRWMSLPALGRRHYLPVGIGLFGGQLLTLAGLWGMPALIHVGIVLTLLGWTTGLAWLVRLLVQHRGRDWHAISAASALSFGWFGLLLFAFYLHGFGSTLALVAIKIGGFGLLLPVYFTVCHRMIPFFSSVVIPRYESVRPMALLGWFWILSLSHLALELLQLPAWLWLVDLPLVALSGWLLWHWWPRQASMPAILRVLYLGFCWLPVAMLLYAGQSIHVALSPETIFGRAPAHALFVGFFGSLLVAMVTRVTQGHSGRPMELGPVAGVAFAIIQLVAVIRIVTEWLPESLLWQVIAAAGWLLAFTPWVVRSGWIYLTPRRDGRPG